MADLEYWLWLSTAGMSPLSQTQLLDRFGSAEEIFHAPREAFDGLNLNPRDRELLESRNLDRAYQVLNTCREQELRIVTYRDSAYPSRLRQISAPPVVLYLRGELPSLDSDPAIAVIGTRRATPYGLKMARTLSYQIARSGGLIISGLTQGIDAMAAQGALQGDGRVLAVLGTCHELDRSFLSRDVVAAGGVLISEYAPGTPSRRYHFRERNRIAAGLSLGVVVVEAPAKSGALLFAEEALEQGKEIFAVPGNADAESSAGTLSLIRDGAMLVTSGWDVMSEFEALYPGRMKRVPAGLEPPALPPREGEREEKAQEPAPPEKHDRPEPEARKEPPMKLRDQLSTLSEDQLKIITAIEKNASHIDDIIEATGLSTATVLAQLTVLQVKGWVRREPGMRIALNITKK